jgi:hypothetical protein
MIKVLIFALFILATITQTTFSIQTTFPTWSSPNTTITKGTIVTWSGGTAHNVR